MKHDLSDITQGLTLLAVIAGVWLVIYELRQAQNIATAQLISDVFDLMQQQHSSVMGENPAIALSLACTHPDSLDQEQMLVLDSYFNSILNRTRRAFHIKENSGISHFSESGGLSLADAGAYNFRSVGATPFGQWWLSIQRFDTAHQEYLESARSQGYFDCRQFGDYQEWLRTPGARAGKN